MKPDISRRINRPQVMFLLGGDGELGLPQIFQGWHGDQSADDAAAEVIKEHFGLGSLGREFFGLRDAVRSPFNRRRTEQPGVATLAVQADFVEHRPIGDRCGRAER